MTELPMQTKFNIAQAGGQIFWFLVYFLSFKTTRLLRPRAFNSNQDLNRKCVGVTRKREKSVIFLASFCYSVTHLAMNKTCSMDINCSWRKIQTIA